MFFFLHLLLRFARIPLAERFQTRPADRLLAPHAPRRLGCRGRRITNGNLFRRQLPRRGDRAEDVLESFWRVGQVRRGAGSQGELAAPLFTSVEDSLVVISTCRRH